MPIWPATPVSESPAVALCSFAAFRTSRKEVHLLGYNATESAGRVSSALVAFNRKTRIATTRSGRKYVLINSPGFNLEALYVLRRWLDVNPVESYCDVTEVLLAKGLRTAIQFVPPMGRSDR
jgi:hypothetical protein